jgi:hypothetical protein
MSELVDQIAKLEAKANQLKDSVSDIQCPKAQVLAAIS